MKDQYAVLIVEDEMVISMELATTLKRLGYRISGQVTSGEDAVRRAGELSPDIVLMDIRLQGEMDGIESAEKIREQYDIPVVFLTAHSDEATLQRAIAVQPSGYLIKPFRDRELYSTIELSIHKHQIRQRLRHSPDILAGLPPLPADIPFLVVSPDWTITAATPAAEQALTAAPGSLLHSRLDHWFARSDEAKPWAVDDPVLLRAEDGTMVPVILTIRPVFPFGTHISGYLVHIRRDTPA